jgi:hypothetical protein
MKIQLPLAISITTAAMCAAAPAAQAGGVGYQFQSPDGNIACVMGVNDAGGATAGCEIGNHTYSPPPKPSDCHLAWGDRFSLTQSNSAAMDCHGDTLRVPGLPTLGYGQTRSVGPLTCDSETASMTCTDNSTGHFFRVAPGSYQLG